MRDKEIRNKKYVIKYLKIIFKLHQTDNWSETSESFLFDFHREETN